MSGKNRILRINDEILREVATIIRSELKDPRLGTLTTVTKVDTTTDLKNCKVFVSIFAEKEEKEIVLEGLTNASGYIRKLLAARINLRNTPELKFIIDDTLDYSMKIDKLIREANKSKGTE